MVINLILLIGLLEQPQNITLHFFYSPDCGHCMDILLSDIPKLQAKYQFELKKYDINFTENYRFLEKMEGRAGAKGDDLPVIFVGDAVLYGPDETRRDLASTLKKLSTRGRPQIHDTTTITVPEKREDGEINIYYFYQTGCKECSRIEILLVGLEKQNTGVKVHRFNIYDDSSKIFFEGLSARNNIPQEKRLVVPAIIMGDDYLIKEDITLQRIEALLKKYEKGSQEFDVSNFITAEQNIFERFAQFSIIGILIAGLLDGVNPCAFATLIFFVSYLLFVGRRRKDVVLMAIFFIAAVFITYLAIGVGAYNILKYLAGFTIIAKIIFWAFGIVAFVLGILSLRDYVEAKKGNFDKMILQLPLGIKQRIHKDIKEKTAIGGIIFGSLVAGFLISFLEFGCTGQVYLPTITFIVSKAGFALKPLLALLVYNLMFVLPLIGIALLATLFTTKNVARSLETKIPTIKFLTALLFFALGALLILSA